MKCIVFTHELHTLYTHYWNVDIVSMLLYYTSNINKSCLIKYLTTYKYMLMCTQTEKEQLAAFKSLSEHCLHQCQRAFKDLNPIFLE